MSILDMNFGITKEMIVAPNVTARLMIANSDPSSSSSESSLLPTIKKATPASVSTLEISAITVACKVMIFCWVRLWLNAAASGCSFFDISFIGRWKIKGIGLERDMLFVNRKLWALIWSKV